MKTTKRLLVLLTFCSLSMAANSQTIECNEFSILGFGPDESNAGNSIVQLYMEGDSSAFISYPYISVVKDCNGDTIAEGELNFFGQVGFTTLGYPITSLGNPICYPINFEFIYINTNFETDTCQLTLNTNTATVESIQIEKSFSVFPNPTSNQMRIQTNSLKTGTTYAMYDYTGKSIFSGTIISENTLLDMSSFSKGMYFLTIGNNLEETIKVVKE